MNFILRKGLCLLAISSMAMMACTENLYDEAGLESMSGLPMTKVINTPSEAVEGCLLITLNDDVEDASMVARSLSQNMEVVSLSRVFPESVKDDEVARKYGLHKWYRLDFKDESLVSAAGKVSKLNEVSAVQYNKCLSPASDCRFTPYTPSLTEMYSPVPVDSPFTFDDEHLSAQWNLINTGSSEIANGIYKAVEGADISVKDAWKLTGGDNRVIVAVIDSPVQYNHPDLAANMWVNEDEVPGNGKDDDNNGYVDDIYGWNCVSGYADSETGLYVNGDIDWRGHDASGHGTHVAGIVAAVNNNGEGVCGVAGGTGNGDGVRLMSCQIFTSGDASIDASARAFYYAQKNGASIAQCSFGYQNGVYQSDQKYSEVESLGMTLEYAAIKYFMDPQNNNSDILNGNIVIAAAGNDHNPQSSYPAALQDVVSVTAIGPDYLPAVSYTNYGPGCNIAAPGGDYYIGNTEKVVDNRSRVLSTFINTITDEYFGAGHDYVYMEGTSMACPHVSGIAALGLSYAYKLGKTFDRDEFISMLLTSVNNIDASLVDNQMKPSGLTSEANLGSYRYKMGTGAIDAWKFLMAIEGVPTLTVKVGESKRYDISSYFGGSSSNFTYLEVTCDQETKDALGLTSDPEMKFGKLSLNPTKVGSGKITVKAIAGYDEDGVVDGWTQVGGMEITRTISVMSRGVVSDNGGWL